jgi:hypothetical protein
VGVGLSLSLSLSLSLYNIYKSITSAAVLTAPARPCACGGGGGRGGTQDLQSPGGAIRVERDLCTVKETYYTVKSDLQYCQKRRTRKAQVVLEGLKKTTRASTTCAASHFSRPLLIIK